MSLLEKIDGPEDLRELSEQELAQLAQEVREHIIDTVGEIGGHFGANLGTCELAVALHSVLESPRDKILWDVGHQAYPHKVLTGRRDQLQHDPPVRRARAVLLDRASPRTTSWAPGTPRPRSATRSGSRRACATSGAEADGKVVAVIGDGAMTGGVAFEAIGQAGGLGTPIVVVLNDNGMSIAPNVGALSRYFNRVRLNPKLWHARVGRRGRPDAPAGRHRRRVRAPRPAPEGVDQGLLGAGAVVGGARLGLHGRDRRPRRARAARGAARGARGANGRWWCTSRPSRARASRRPRTAAWRAWRSGTRPSPSRSSTARPRTPRRARRPTARTRRRAPPPPQYTQVFGEALVRECERDERVVGITAAMNSGHRPEHPAEGDARPLLRRRHRRAAGDPVRRRAWRSRASSRWRRSTPRSCSAPTTRSCTTCACRS